jgi:hypothetical protein
MEHNMNFLDLLKKGEVRGSGTGVSDSVPAVIKGGKPQPAALSVGEYVVRADVVSNLGGGATNGGVEFFDTLMPLINQMDRDTASTFADTVLQVAQVFLDKQPQIDEDIP